MTQEEKKLLLKDLCARLPYGVILDYSFIEDKQRIHTKIPLTYRNIGTVALDEWHTNEEIFKPYLRPMSSMTEEEFEELKEYSGLKYEQLDLASFQNGTYKCLDFYLSEIPSYVVILVFDWLNSHHFDYRGLIERGLALEAPEGMYKF